MHTGVMDVIPSTADGTAAASVDLLALENQVCFALAVAARNVIGCTGRCSSRWASRTRSTS